MDTSSAARLAGNLVDAVNRHDLEALVGCFHGDFVNETPVHPARSFNGSEQVRRNWGQIFAAIPDLKAEAVRQAFTADSVWIEWEMKGTRVDGADHLMRGVTVFGIRADRFAWVRFYLEPVEAGGAGIDAAVREQLVR